MTDPTRAEILALYRGRPDMTAKQIAAHFGFSTAKLYYLLKKYGVELGRKRQPEFFKRPDIKAWEYKRWYYNPTKTVNEIAARFDIGPGSVHRVATARGLMTRAELEQRGLFTPEYARSSTRKNWHCKTCYHRQWCDDNPHADKLPCEVDGSEPVPYVRPEMSELSSPNGGVALSLGLAWDDDGDV